MFLLFCLAASNLVSRKVAEAGHSKKLSVNGSEAESLRFSILCFNKSAPLVILIMFSKKILFITLIMDRNNLFRGLRNYVLCCNTHWGIGQHIHNWTTISVEGKRLEEYISFNMCFKLEMSVWSIFFQNIFNETYYLKSYMSYLMHSKIDSSFTLIESTDWSTRSERRRSFLAMRWLLLGFRTKLISLAIGLS